MSFSIDEGIAYILGYVHASESASYIYSFAMSCGSVPMTVTNLVRLTSLAGPSQALYMHASGYKMLILPYSNAFFINSSVGGSIAKTNALACVSSTSAISISYTSPKDVKYITTQESPLSQNFQLVLLHLR